ncbi:LPXTG cell wall anchor domain-containing protein [Lactococcus petauri]|uniref:LPXTG cell wall anchor domain-containing protein n=1 Tax=Lactococcus petauri TaxID=1940789 RepID=UPI00254D4B54|nr:LPXTG cell wall anchor domain-containing protein [Lactococcus petauri]
MMKSKKLQYLFLISGVVLSFVSSEVKASSLTEEAFLPVQGFLVHEQLQEENTEKIFSYIDDNVEISKQPTIFDSLPETGENIETGIPVIGIILVLMTTCLWLRKKRREEI